MKTAKTIVAAALVALAGGLAMMPGASAHCHRHYFRRLCAPAVVQRTLVAPAVIPAAPVVAEQIVPEPVVAEPVMPLVPLCRRHHHHLLGVYTPLFGFHLF